MIFSQRFYMRLRIFVCAVFVCVLCLWPQAGFAVGNDMGNQPQPPQPPQPGEGGRANPDLPFSRDLHIDIPKLPGLEEDFLQTPIPLQPLPPPSSAPAPSADGFVLQSIELEGVTLYRSAELEKIYKIFLGKYMSFDDLQKITRRIETFYTNEGWLTANAVIPPQEIANGRLKIKVFEGRLAGIFVEGKAGNAEGIIQSYLADLKSDRPIKTAVLNEGLSRLQDLRGLAIHSRLRQAESGQAGGVDLVVDVRDRKLISSGGVFVNNVSNEAVGPWVMSVSSVFNSLIQGGDQLSLLVSNSILNPDETLVGRISYEQLIPKIRLGVSYQGLAAENDNEDFAANVYGTVIGTYIGGNWTRPDGQISNTPTEDRGLTAGIYLRLPFYRSAIFNMESLFEYDFESRRTQRVDDGEVQTEGDSHILSAGLTVNYRSSWRRWGGFTSLTAKIRQGLTEGGGPDSGSPRVNVAFGGTVFTRRGTWLTGNLSHNQLLWPSERLFFLPLPSVSLFISATGQYAFRPLPNSENIAFGNSNIGRGFNSGRISGDHGWGTSTEMRFEWNQVWNQENIVLYGFFDQAQIANVVKNQLTENRMIIINGQPQRSGSLFPTRNLFSAGFGLRIRLFNSLQVDASWAYALNNPFKKTIGFVGSVPLASDLSDKGHSDFLLRLAYFF